MEIDSDLIADMEETARNLYDCITVMKRFFEVDVVRPLESSHPHEKMTFEARAHYGEIKRAMRKATFLRQGFRRICHPSPNDNKGGQ